MGKLMVRYKVKSDQAARNEELVRAIYEELKATAPDDLSYATFVLEDGVSFIHLASVEAYGDQNPLMAVEAFRAFQTGIQERCEEPPVATPLREIGSFRFWDT